MVCGFGKCNEFTIIERVFRCVAKAATCTFGRIVKAHMCKCVPRRDKSSYDAVQIYVCNESSCVKINSWRVLTIPYKNDFANKSTVNTMLVN